MPTHGTRDQKVTLKQVEDCTATMFTWTETQPLSQIGNNCADTPSSVQSSLSVCLVLSFSRGSRSRSLQLSALVLGPLLPSLCPSSLFPLSVDISWCVPVVPFSLSNDMRQGHRAVSPNSSTASRVMCTLFGTEMCLFPSDPCNLCPSSRQVP